MDKKSKWLIIIFFIFIIISIMVTFYKYIILKDYEVFDNVRSSII
ncbi:MAG: hypothetical protein Q7S72_01585 [Candidatus Taylorbacteria bacterium]|nr:hypothetical protein [Candidatus Taylorbacteria bacterium]